MRKKVHFEVMTKSVSLLPTTVVSLLSNEYVDFLILKGELRSREAKLPRHKDKRNHASSHSRKQQISMKRILLSILQIRANSRDVN